MPTESKLPAVIYPESNQIKVGYERALKDDINLRLSDIIKDLNELNDCLNKFEEDLKDLRRPRGLLGRIATFFTFRQ